MACVPVRGSLEVELRERREDLCRGRIYEIARAAAFSGTDVRVGPLLVTLVS